MARLEARAERLVHAPAATVRMAFPVLGFTEGPPPGPQQLLLRDGSVCVFAPWRDDPVRLATGRLDIPPELALALRAADAAGVRFDAVYVARLVDDACAARRRGGARAAGALALRTLDAIGRGLTLAHLCGLGLDPILCGALVDERGRTTMWMDAGRWT